MEVNVLAMVMLFSMDPATMERSTRFGSVMTSSEYFELCAIFTLIKIYLFIYFTLQFCFVLLLCVSSGLNFLSSIYVSVSESSAFAWTWVREDGEEKMHARESASCTSC